MSFLEQRQEQRLRLLLLSPAVLILVICGLTVLTAHRPGFPPRETALDVITTLAPRPAADLETATILIDQESADRLGDWPWPRSAFGALIDAAEAAGAASVTLTVPVSGEDPLSPEVVAKRWLTAPGMAGLDDIDVISALPSNDLILAHAAAGGPVALTIAHRVRGTDEAVAWSGTGVSGTGWLRAERAGGRAEVPALPTAPGERVLAPELREARVLAVAGLPADPDGVVRHAAPVYAVGGLPAAAAGLAAIAASGEPVTLTLRSGLLSSAAPTPGRLQIGAGAGMALNARSEFRLWMPKDPSVPSLSAWRVIDDPAAWTRSLEGTHVFIGETLTPRGTVRTSRGRMPLAKAQALVAGQLASGLAPTRPGWAGFVEATAAAALGAIAVLGVIFLPTVLGAALTVLIAGLSLAAAYGVFRATGMLFDPAPAMLATLAGPIAVGTTVLANMVIRDDRVRGAFHGALPQKAMRQVQSHGGRRLLTGVHRDVTVLSCALQLPPGLIESFTRDPDAYMQFKASANDRLRRTILDFDGTVDYGEDGRLLGYWNVPLDEPKHVERACACALRMLDDVSAMSHQVSEGHDIGGEAGAEDLSDGRIEIGIATGPCFAGPVGMGGRNRYAALGQPVRVAGLLRGRSELYGPAILTDARVHDALRHHYAFLDLDLVRRDEGSGPEIIYGLVGNPFLKASKTFRDLAEVQRGLLEAWREQDLGTATRQLQKLRGIPGVPQAYVELFEKRILQARLSKGRHAPDVAAVLGA
mgnify:FL=1